MDSPAKLVSRVRDPEELIAYLMVHFDSALSAAMGPKRGRHQKMPPMEGRTVPAMTALAVVALAGQHDPSECTTVADIFAASASPGVTASRVRALSEAIAQDFNGGLLDASWLVSLASGVGARGEARARILGFAGTPGRGRLRPRHIADYVSGFVRESRRAAQATVSADLRVLHESTVEPLSRLPRPPYPSHLTVSHLAEALDVAFLDDEAGSDIFASVSLYSRHTPHLSRLAAVDTVTSLRRGVVLGDPGSGKTTILQATCLQRIQRTTGATIFARLDALGELAERRPPTTLTEALRLVVQAWDGWRRGECTAKQLDHVITLLQSQESAFIALDGLDEISTSERYDAAARVLDLVDAIPGTIVVTSRITGFVQPALLDQVLVVPPMREGAPQALIDTWFGSSPARSIAKKRAQLALDGDFGLSDIAHNPLIAGFVCAVAEYDDVRQTKHGLYGQYIERFLAGSWRKPTARPLPRGTKVLESLDVATQIAWKMAATPDAEQDRWLDSVRMSILADDPTIGQQGIGIYESIGLLVPHKVGDPQAPLSQEVRWLHRTIHEHLVGRALFRMLVSDPDEAMARIRSALLRPSWQVPLEHAMGFLHENGRLDAVIDNVLVAFEDCDPLHRPHEHLAHLLGTVGSRHRIDELAERLVERGTIYQLTTLGCPERVLRLDFAQLPHDALWEVFHVLSNLPMTAEKRAAYRQLAEIPTGGWERSIANGIDDVDVALDRESAIDRGLASLVEGQEPSDNLLRAIMMDRPDQAIAALRTLIGVHHHRCAEVAVAFSAASDASRELVAQACRDEGAFGEILLERVAAHVEDRDFDVFRCSRDCRIAALRGDFGMEVSWAFGRKHGEAEASLPASPDASATNGYWTGVSTRDYIQVPTRSGVEQLAETVRSVTDGDRSAQTLAELNRALAHAPRQPDRRAIPHLHALYVVLSRPWVIEDAFIADYRAVDLTIHNFPWPERLAHWRTLVSPEAPDGVWGLGAMIVEEVSRSEPQAFMDVFSEVLGATAPFDHEGTGIRDLIARPNITIEQFPEWLELVDVLTRRAGRPARRIAVLGAEGVAYTLDRLDAVHTELIAWMDDHQNQSQQHPIA